MTAPYDVASTATDQLVTEFILCTLPREAWTHPAHLKVGLWHLLRYSPSQTLAKLRRGIQKYNLAWGIENTASQGYHETITQFYIWLIQRFLQQSDCSRPLDILADELIHDCGDQQLPLKYYSYNRLMSSAARLAWLEPDLMPFPSGDTPTPPW